MNENSWHQHGGGNAPNIRPEQQVEVWPVGCQAPTKMQAGQVNWSARFRWREVNPAPPPPTATATLRRAADLLDERGRQYDQPGGERSMGRAVAAFNAITGRDLTEPEGWLLLQVLKDVRQWQRPGYHADSAEDCVAYAALKAEALARSAGNE